jgi:transposase
MVINPAHAKALKGHKTDAKDAIRLLDLYECGLLSGSYIPPAELKEVRDLARYRMKTVQARTSEIQRLQKTLESAGIKLCSVVSEVTGASATAMIEALIDGERRGAVLAELAQGRMRSRQKMADLPMALAGRFTAHHALMCRLHLDRIKVFDEAVAGLDATIAPLVARYSQEAELLKTLPGFGDVVVAGWLGAIGPAPHEYFATAGRLASWTTVCPGNYMSAKKSKGGQTGDGGAYIKPLLVQAAWAATRVPGRLQAKFRRLVRKFGGPKNKGAIKRAIMAIAHTLLKIAYQVLKTGTPYHDLGADFYASRESPQARQDYLIRQLHKLNPGCIITIGGAPDLPDCGSFRILTGKDGIKWQGNTGSSHLSSGKRQPGWWWKRRALSRMWRGNLESMRPVLGTGCGRIVRSTRVMSRRCSCLSGRGCVSWSAATASWRWRMPS